MTKPLRFEGKVPTISELWGALQKLGWSYSGGWYQVKDLETAFGISNIENPCHFMLEHGIPNIEKLKLNDQQTEAESLLQQQIEQMIKFVNAPLSDLTSANQGLNGFSNEILSDKDVEELLKYIEICKSHIPGSWRLGVTRSFDNLDQVRLFVRQADILPGRRLCPKKRLSLRLWAALSQEPLPVFDIGKHQSAFAAVPPTNNDDVDDPKPLPTTSRRSGKLHAGNTDSDSDADTSNDRGAASSRVSDISEESNTNNQGHEGAGDGMQKTVTNVDYESLSVKDIATLTKRHKRELRDVRKEDVRKQKQAVDEINVIVNEIRHVQEELIPAQTNPVPLFDWTDTTEWEEIAQAHEQATSELKRLKKRKSIIRGDQEAVEEIRRIKQNWKLPFVRNMMK